MLLVCGIICALLGISWAQPEMLPLSCANSQVPSWSSLQSDFCSTVNYNAARMYPKSSFTFFETGNPLSAYEHQRSAGLFFRAMFEDISNRTGISALALTKTCVDTMTDFVCLLAYPPCPLENLPSSSMQSVSYLSPCKVHCTLINYHCVRHLRASEGLHPEALSHWYQCENYPTENCAMNLDDSSVFALLPAFNPYAGGLQALYSVLLPVWFLVAVVVHHYGLSRERVTKVESLTALLVPLMKVVSLTFCLTFWSTCLSSVCYRWLANALINTHLMYEAVKLFYFLLLAKGWLASRNVLNVENMRSIVLVSGLFFLASTIIVAFSAGGNEPRVALLCLYILVYGYMLLSTYHNLRGVDKSAESILSITGHADDAQAMDRGDEDEGLGAAARRPLLFKRRLFFCFLLLVLVSIVAECFYHVLQFESIAWLVLLAVYEILDLGINCAMLFLFRPRSLSPFFFIVSVDSNTQWEDGDETPHGLQSFDAHENPVPMENDEDFSDAAVSADIETAPLISSCRSNVEMVPAKLMVVRNPSALKLAVKHIDL